jgi:prepilin-type N-terminal cleavage/methylation domain-containing protein
VKRTRGFTLVEILVATAILTVLGTSLVVVLRGGVKTWRRGEARRESFEVAQTVLAQLREDLEAATIDASNSHGESSVETKLICDQDKLGRQRLALVRTIKAETESPLTGQAGRYVGGTSRVDQRGDLKDLEDGTLRATGGLAEVAWALGAEDDETLFRGFRSPIGEKGSFFKGDQAFFLAPLLGAPAPKTPQDPAPGIGICRPMAARVVHLGFHFWTPYTTTWDSDHRPVRWFKGNEDKSGPLDYWDSTRAILKPEGNDHRYFDTFLSDTSLNNPDDDLLPMRVKVTLVVREGDSAESTTYLFRALNPSDKVVYVGEPDRLPKEGWVRVGHEWIRYDAVEGNRLSVVERGGRGTRAVDHGLNDEVLIGRTFEIVVDLPAAREDWGDR